MDSVRISNAMQQLRELLDFAEMAEPQKNGVKLTPQDKSAINYGISALKTLLDMQKKGN